MELNWIKCNTEKWCNFLRVNLDHNHFDNLTGVYIIWKPTDEDHNTVRLGQGVIRDRLAEHRDNPEIINYGADLCVTWAAVPSGSLAGVEAYLAAVLEPKVGDRFPNVPQIQVNLPGQE